MTHEWRRDAFAISTDPARLDLDRIHAVLTASYWAGGISHEIVRRSIERSLPFGVYHDGEQVGFARVITDFATFAYLADVFVLDAWQGRGLGAWLVETIMAHPELQGLRRWMLLTRDAHGLYRKFGWTAPARPEAYMEKWDPAIYSRP